MLRMILKKTSFYFLKIFKDFNFFSKIDWSMNSGPLRAGDSKEYLKKIFLFANSTKNSNEVWTI